MMVSMSQVRIEQVDERDSSWEDPRPRFRVYLHGSGEATTHGSTSTYDITGADILQVLDWAQRQAGDSMTYAVALVRDDAAEEHRSPGHGRGLVWLVGMDGNDTPRDGQEVETQARMLARRFDPVRLPTRDLMPSDSPDPHHGDPAAR